MSEQFSVSDLESYLDEALPPEAMAKIEAAARDDTKLGRRLASILARRDAGVHSLGEIWRRERLTCPQREQLGSYLLGVLAKDHAEYICFHLEVVACRYCTANLADLQSQVKSADEEIVTRRRKYFQSSAGYLKG